MAFLLPLLAVAEMSSCKGKTDPEPHKVAVKIELTLEPYTDEASQVRNPVWAATDVVKLTNKSTGESVTAKPLTAGQDKSTFLFSMTQPSKGDVLWAEYPVADPLFDGQTVYSQKVSGEKISLVYKNAIDPIVIDDPEYPMMLTARTEISEGVTYERYTLTKQSDAYVHIVNVDMTRPDIVLDAVLSNEIVPNPCDATSNNGKRLRETISEAVNRRKAEGKKIIAAVNGDYYATVPGILLSCHVQDGEAVFINNPYERKIEPYFLYGITQFEDRSLSTDARIISCKARLGSKEVEVFSVNDTIVNLSPKAASGARPYQSANVYTHRFVKTPFADKPELQNKIGTNALFIVAKAADVLKVNTGYVESVITAVYDGRSSSLSEAPYVSGKGEWVLQLTGSAADDFALAKVGDAIAFRADITIGGQTKPIRSHIGGKYRFVTEGKPSTGTDDPRSDTRHTMVALDKDGKNLRLITIQWTSSFRAASRICILLGCYNVVKCDGGGSTCMWIDRNGGELVQKSTDSRGPERSNMNYIQIRKL